VPVTADGVETAPFLEASEGLVKIFNLFGNPAFSVVQNDITGNINVSADSDAGKLSCSMSWHRRPLRSAPFLSPQPLPSPYPPPPAPPAPAHPQKVRTYFLANPTDADTLEKLLAHDKATHAKPKERVATDALMWLLRGLKFTAMGLRINLSNSAEELSVSFTKGYEGSLKKFHGMMVRPVFAVSRGRGCSEMERGVAGRSGVAPSLALGGGGPVRAHLCDEMFDRRAWQSLGLAFEEGRR
jgi:hypothetical protein